MAVTPERAAATSADVAAQRRWLITIVITIAFGGFGAVMAYLSYAKSSKPSDASTSKSRSSSTSPSTPPDTLPSVAPPAAEPRSGDGAKDKPEKGKPEKRR